LQQAGFTAKLNHLSLEQVINLHFSFSPNRNLVSVALSLYLKNKIRLPLATALLDCCTDFPLVKANKQSDFSLAKA
jgi:hypothetical protein